MQLTVDSDPYLDPWHAPRLDLYHVAHVAIDLCLFGAVRAVISACSSAIDSRVDSAFDMRMHSYVIHASHLVNLYDELYRSLAGRCAFVYIYIYRCFDMPCVMFRRWVLTGTKCAYVLCWIVVSVHARVPMRACIVMLA